MTIKSEVTKVPFKQILIPEDNVRHDLPKVKELAALIEVDGLLQPVVVTNGGEGDKPYRLVAGFRRAAAWKLLGWEGREIPVLVREYKKGDVTRRLIDNLKENIDREDIHPLDVAERVHEFVTGSYPVDEGETAVALSKPEIAAIFGWKQSHITNLLRIFTLIDADVAKQCRKHRAPFSVMFKLASVEPKGRDEDAKAESRHALQSAILAEWVAAQEALAQTGRSRAKRGSKAKAKAEEEESVALKPTKKVGPEYKVGEKERDGELVPVQKRYSAQEYLAVITHKSTEKGLSVAESHRLQGAIDTLRFLTGELKKFPGLVAADFEVLSPPEEESDEDDGDSE